MKFLCIATPNTDNAVTAGLLAEACKQRQIDFAAINPLTFDYTRPPEKEPFLLYRATPFFRKGAKETEFFLLSPRAVTFYRSYERSLLENRTSFVIHEKMGVPVPLTMHHLSTERSLLKKYVEALGGFPVIIKVLNGSHGVGVIKVDSQEGLFSLVDYLERIEERYIMRKFIDARKSCRLIVLDDKVIDSIEYIAPEDDFRSGVGAVPNAQPKTFSEHVQQIAVRAVQTLGLEFGGVDILLDRDGKPYVTEVNFPCYFPRCQMLTGIDISGMMVDHLLKKARA